MRRDQLSAGESVSASRAHSSAGRAREHRRIRGGRGQRLVAGVASFGRRCKPLQLGEALRIADAEESEDILERLELLAARIVGGQLRRALAASAPRSPRPEPICISVVASICATEARSLGSVSDS